jgi:hypothetical protein
MRRLLWDSSLRDQFHVKAGWAVLRGWHHRYLKHEPVQFCIGDGIVDLAMAHQSGHVFRVEYLTEERSNRLYLMVDPLEVSLADLMALKDVIRERRNALAGSARPRPAPNIADLDAWLSYLRCYDSRQQGATYGQISRIVLGGPVRQTAAAVRKRKSLHRQVTRACQRVTDLIRWAEQGPWIFSRL